MNENDEITDEILIKTIHDSIRELKQRHPTGCKCEQWTGICLKHGTIRGSERCSKCDGYRGYDDMSE